MTGILDTLAGVFIRNGLVTAFAFVGSTIWIYLFPLLYLIG